MVARSLRVGSGLLAALAVLSAACFVDAIGQPAGAGGAAQGGDGGATTSGFTGGGGAGAAGAGVSTGGGGTSQGGAGGGPPSTCGDGVAVNGEACEDGNTAAGDGCSPACELESTCGNFLVEPTEECDPPSVSCDALCKSAAGTACADAVAVADPMTDQTVLDAAPSNPFLIPVSSGEFQAPCDTFTDASIRTNVYRVQIGPYPEGLFLKAKKKGDFDPVLALYDGCGSGPVAPQFCAHSDNAIVVSDVQPPGSVMFATVGDRANGGDFDLFVWFHRYWTRFDVAIDWAFDPISWIQGFSELTVIGAADADGFSVVSPAIFVGGLDTFEVVLDYGLEASMLSLEVSFDNGAFEQLTSLPSHSYDNPDWERVSFDKQAGAEMVKVRVTYATANTNARARLLALRVQPVAPFDTW